MERFKVGDTVRVVNGGMEGEIILITDGFAQVRFAKSTSKIALSELKLVSK